jgi:hypothetical protein
MRSADVIVVGGGAAGLMAAGQAAESGARVLVLEKMPSPGRKLLLTGKTRCNLTNMDTIQQSLDHFNREGRFLTQVFYQFFNQDLRTFFHTLGVPTEEQRGGRVFPVSERAQDVLDALLGWLNRLEVTLLTDQPVSRLHIQDDRIRGVTSGEKDFTAPAVILAAGGKAYPGTGSTGDGYALAGQAGHTITPVFPALVPLVTAGETARQLQGLSLKNVTVNLWVEGEKKDDLFGEMLFTHFGLSGPIILTLSRQIVQHLRAGRQVEIAIDLKPALDHPTLDRRLLRDIQQQGRKQYSSLLSGLLPSSLVPICAAQTRIPWEKKLNQLTGEDRKTLRMWLKEDFRFQVVDHRGFGQAIITAGGVDVSEVDPRTMASLLARGLYFAGEILDVDADTGGYNLQAAFSTGWAAGRSAAGKNS